MYGVTPRDNDSGFFLIILWGLITGRLLCCKSMPHDCLAHSTMHFRGGGGEQVLCYCNNVRCFDGICVNLTFAMHNVTGGAKAAKEPCARKNSTRKFACIAEEARS